MVSLQKVLIFKDLEPEYRIENKQSLSQAARQSRDVDMQNENIKMDNDTTTFQQS